MKALFFDNDLYMGMREVEHPQPEYKMMAPKNLKVSFEGEPLDQLSIPQSIKVVFRMFDYSRKFVIYQLFGYED